MSTDSNFLRRVPEIWAGIECTINRVNGLYYDQLEWVGHYVRSGDIDKIASLGIKALRYPVLWELHEKTKGQEIEWDWIEKQLLSIRSHNIIPIVGLLHHGSGPSFTGLIDKNFPEEFAAYAEKVATKFPWLEYYTPINEPLTTARFSGLYGFWYPHHKNDRSFLLMLINQLKGIVLSMQAITKLNPSAKLVQTEDLAKIYSTPGLKYQADFENERRWLTYDILCGKFDRHHYLWNYVIANGITEAELYFFIENKCPPDIMGLNYYVTSERFLDDRVEKYPGLNCGGNGIDEYVDIEAVRADGIGMKGPYGLLKEAWSRYALPIAITEVHLNCTRDHQLRWFGEIWDTANKVKAEGVDIRAVTAWSALGAYNWSNLLTKNDGIYESGVFDLKNKSCRPTALSKMIRSLTQTGAYHHPLLEREGWWRNTEEQKNIQNEHGILIIGKNGTLGNAFARICKLRNIPFKALDRKDLDLYKKDDIDTAINLYKPWAIINATGYVRVDEAENDRQQCFYINAMAPALLAACCEARGIQFMTFSSDLVFNGLKLLPYTEEDTVSPLNVYGESKAQGEKMIIDSSASALIIRTSSFFGPWDRYNFVYYVLDSIRNNRTFDVVSDVFVSPTYVPDLVNASLDLLIDGEKGIWHLTNEGIVSWAEFAHNIASRAGIKTNALQTKGSLDMDWIAARPPYSALNSIKGSLMPGLDNALERYFKESTF